MKLNPPASSSDLEAAREIARRLHQRRRRADFARSEDARPPLERPAHPVLAPPPPTPGRAAKARTDAPAFPPRPAVPRALPHETAPPSWDDAGDGEPPMVEEHLTGALGDLTGDLPDGQSPAEAAEGESAVDEGTEEAPAEAVSPDLSVEVEVETEDVTVSPDEMVGSPDGSGSDEDDLFGERLGGDLRPSPPSEPDETPGALGTSEELFDEPALPPSWDDVVESCREMAGASGAMIIDPAGQVFAARGEWPEPGPEAIAGRLVAMMERTLRDAPTRSVSAPVGGHHLTAWRVPLAEGLVTAAFIADMPLRSEVRSAIDAEIHRGAGA